METFAKFKLEYKYDGSVEEYPPCTITHEFPGDITVTQFLYQVECFLKAAGFVFDGKIELVEDNYKECCNDDCDCITTPCETSTWDEQFDVTKTSVSSEDSISAKEYQKRRNWNEAEKKLKEWNESIAKLDNEQKQKCREEALKMSDLHYEATKEVVKNNWVHGMCNPPSPDWKKQK